MREKTEFVLNPADSECYAEPVLEDRSEAVVCIRFIDVAPPLASRPVPAFNQLIPIVTTHMAMQNAIDRIPNQSLKYGQWLSKESLIDSSSSSGESQDPLKIKSMDSSLHSTFGPTLSLSSRLALLPGILWNNVLIRVSLAFHPIRAHTQLSIEVSAVLERLEFVGKLQPVSLP